MHPNSQSRGRTVMIGPVSIVTRGSSCRVTADVDGVPLWFESADLPLAASPEAFASAALIPTLHHRRRLWLDEPVDPVWRENIGRMIPLLRGWWGYPDWPPETRVTPFEAGAERAARDPENRPSALFFSGGVDSFYCLLRGETRPDWIVTLWGFDFPLDDLRRGAAVETSVRQIADETGTHAAMVRTNARQHPLIAATPWERTHGGILAAVGHLLAPTVTRAIMASSPPADLDIPYGSHWSLDPLWSSSRTSIVHQGRGQNRVEKLRAIAAEPLVREHLRVCWQNLAPVGNCSRCAKCLLAMLILEECGELEHSRAFEGRSELAARIDARPKNRDRYPTFDELSRSPNLDPHLAASVRALVKRSRHARRLDVRMRRAAVDWLISKLGGGHRGTPEV